jgi:Tfp pilus assembly protein FimT
MEMVVIILVIGILAAIAAAGTNSVLSRSSANSKTLWVTDWLIAAQSMYGPRSVTDATYTYEQALIDTAADLKAYTALAEGTAAVDTTVSNYRIQSDTGPSVYSTAANHVVVQEATGTLYLAVMLDSSRAIFAKVTTSGAPQVWIATCSTTSCDAEQARNNGKPSSGGYTPDGTITSTTAAPTTTTAGVTTSLAPTTTVAGAPGAPTSVSAALSGGTTALVSYTAPSVVGSSAISTYRATCTSSNGGSTRTSTSRANPMPVYVLSYGKSYTCTVAAKNQSGFSPESAASGALSPYAAPDAPTITSVGSSDAQLSLSFTPGSANGSAITNYEYSLDAGFTWTTRSPSSTASPIAVIGVTNSRSYTVSLRAVNAAGAGAASTVSSTTSGTPSSGPPGAPTIQGITPGDSQLTVAFQAPLAIGGSAISNYQYSTDSGTTWTTRSPSSASSPLVISGLTNGTTYQVVIKAVNSQGAGSTSAVVEATAYTTPCAPTISSVTPGLGQLTVAFSTPSCTGGKPLTNYEYSTDNGSTFSALSPASTSSPFVITGLQNGATYQVKLRAVNIAGAGTSSAASSGTPYTVPGAPSITSITPGNGQLSVAFSAPASNGGAAISNYQYSTDGTTWTTRSPASASSPLVITGLQNGTSYSVTLKAVNVAGSGSASSASTSTPYTVPGAPTLSSASASLTSSTLNFSAPASNGGSAITGYTASCPSSDGGTAGSASGAGSPLSVTLTQGKTYTCSVTAVNAAGSSAASAAKTFSPSYTANYSCGAGESGGGTSSTCYTVASGWVSNIYVAPYSCSGDYGVMAPSTGVSYTAGPRGGPYYDTLDPTGHCNTHVYYYFRADSSGYPSGVGTKCWKTAAQAAAGNTTLSNQGTCGATYPYQQYLSNYSGNAWQVDPWCGSFGIIIGYDTPFFHTGYNAYYCQKYGTSGDGYYSSPSVAYTSTTNNPIWAGWGVS